MFPFRTSSIFRSRWIALLWAGGIIWTAVDFAGRAPARDNGAAVDEQAQAAAILNGIGR